MTTVNLDLIKYLRKKHGFSQSDMAEMLGFNSLYPYHRKERGDQAFTAEELHEISKIFRVEVENFFTHSVAKNAI